MVHRLALAVGLVVLLPQVAAAEERPLYYERALTAADLDGRTLRELSLMRNTIYARAGHTFRKKWLIDYFTAQPWYHALAKDDDSKITAVDRANAKAIAQVEQNQPRAALEKRRDDLLARQRAGKIVPGDDVELHLVNTRLGGVAAGDKEPEAARDPLEDPSQLDRLLKVEQLSNLSRRDLRLLRNTIYARHGRDFKSPLLQRYFEAMSWYQIDPNFSDKNLTKIDETNVKLIKSVENTLGGPMTDDEQRHEDGWLYAS
jgi:YARHG domain-containing protein